MVFNSSSEAKPLVVEFANTGLLMDDWLRYGVGESGFGILGGGERSGSAPGCFFDFSFAMMELEERSRIAACAVTKRESWPVARSRVGFVGSVLGAHRLGLPVVGPTAVPRVAMLT